MVELANHFALDGAPVTCEKYGSGHINKTYRLLDSTGREYILQKINRKVFTDPESLMRNISLVTDYLRKVVSSQREVLSLIPTKSGEDWFTEEDGSYWRVYDFIPGSICLDVAESPADFRESAIAFGRFQQQLADFPADTLIETIPRFHDTPNRYTHLQQAIGQDCRGRAREAEEEIAFALAREEFAPVLLNLLEKGDLPLRVTHNDTKLNNVLFDEATRKAVCVIDLDTVMPGLAANDYGDAIRFGASTAVEDEQDLDKVHFSLPLFEAYTEGYLSTCGKSLTECEVEHLCHGAKMMTLECGVRFLTDHLNGDTYFGISREGHNLDRCRTQFRLVREMEEQWDAMQGIVRALAK